MSRRCVLYILSFLICSEYVIAENQFDNLREQFAKNGIKSLFLEQKNIENREVVELGRMLFFDRVLSGNKDIACAACHHPQLSSSDALPVSIGTGGVGLGPQRQKAKGDFIARNAPAIFNLGFKSFQKTMWDGRISIEEDGQLNTPEPILNGKSPRASKIVQQLKSVGAAQAMFPVTSHDEMRGHPGENEIASARGNIAVWDRLMARLLKISKYRELFMKAFPSTESFDDFNFGHAARAIAAFESFAFLADQAPIDHFLSGDDSALTEQQIRGARLFLGKVNCVSCHSGSHFTDFDFYSLGVPQLGPGKGDWESRQEDRGLALQTGLYRDNYKFKVPTLRNVELTGPWMHSGAYHSLEDVVRHHTLPQMTCKDFTEKPQKFMTVNYLEDFMGLIDLNHQRNKKRMSSIDKKLPRMILSQQETEDLVEFLRALTDESFRERVIVPESVPSGLPVDFVKK